MSQPIGSGSVLPGVNFMEREQKRERIKIARSFRTGFNNKTQRGGASPSLLTLCRELILMKISDIKDIIQAMYL